MAETETQVRTIRVMYCPEWRVWFTSRYDTHGYQIGEGEDTYLLSTATERACRSRNDEPTCRDAEIEIYYRDGGLRKTL